MDQLKNNIGNIELIKNVEQILSTLRHEVGNSINSLKITLDVLRENYDLFDDIKKRDYLKRLSEAVDRQEKLVEAMKFYSRFDVEEQKEIQFVDLWNDFLSMTADRLKGVNIDLIHSLDVEPRLIRGNNLALIQVMTVIMDNAIEAVEDKENPRIELRALEDNGFVKILLKDNGSGIRKHDLQKVFTPLFTTKPGKMGMGLPITRKLLVKMEGWINVESLFESGTEAIIWLRTVGG